MSKLDKVAGDELPDCTPSIAVICVAMVECYHWYLHMSTTKLGRQPINHQRLLQPPRPAQGSGSSQPESIITPSVWVSAILRPPFAAGLLRRNDERRPAYVPPYVPPFPRNTNTGVFPVRETRSKGKCSCRGKVKGLPTTSFKTVKIDRTLLLE